MSSDVKAVTEVAKELATIKARSQVIAQEFKANIEDVKESLAITEQVSKALREAGAELRGLLGTHTNNPPADDK